MIENGVAGAEKMLPRPLSEDDTQEKRKSLKGFVKYDRRPQF